MNKYRTHHCGELNLKNIGQVVKLSGWINRKRDHGSLLFVDLRDHYGITQIVFNSQELLLDQTISNESVIIVTGTVVAREQRTINNNLTTGEIEVVADSYELESLAIPLPFMINSPQEIPEELGLQYRFLELRREKLHSNIILRSQVIEELRKLMRESGFMEFQTPILTASSPEGARDFLVPSRLHPGKFYALPQAPQQFKQLLMMAGFDRYFQIAPCFRDEDARADRSPGEFYQLDIEMSFVNQEDVFTTVEPVIYNLFAKFAGDKQVSSYPFPRITYQDAMLKYGTDKPDLRNPIIIMDLTHHFRDSAFTIFRQNIAKGQVIRAICVPQAASNPRSFFDQNIEFAKQEKAAGLNYLQFTSDEEVKGPLAKFMKCEEIENIRAEVKLETGDVLFLICDYPKAAATLAGKLRTKLGKDLKLIDDNVYKFCWIVDFPLYEWNDEQQRLDFHHNPFSMPQGGIATLEQAQSMEDLLAIKAYQYDIVCNGVELSSGAIRNHKPEIMYKAFALAGYSKEHLEQRFGAMINALKYGAPPHGGIAPGVDRIVMLLADAMNLREVIAFPFNQRAEDLLMNAPSPVDAKQLQDLGLMLIDTAKNGGED